ncbi:hypothetical protein PENTCL1PPCAC_4818, partial [Pristionchus entomophagus]
SSGESGMGAEGEEKVFCASAMEWRRARDRREAGSPRAMDNGEMTRGAGQISTALDSRRRLISSPTNFASLFAEPRLSAVDDCTDTRDMPPLATAEARTGGRARDEDAARAARRREAKVGHEGRGSV